MSQTQRPAPEGAGSVRVTGPGTATLRGGGPPRPILIGLGVVAAIAAVLLAVFLLRSQPEPVGEASPSPTTSSTPEATADASPSATTRTTPDPNATAAPTIPESWTEVAVFSEPGKRYVLGDLVAWADGLIAVGTLYEEAGRSVFGPPPPRTGRVWRSTDGTEWTDATPDGTLADVELMHLLEAADGALIVIGHAYPELDPVAVAWETRDGQTWTTVELPGISDGSAVNLIGSGARGHVASTFGAAGARGLYSADGRAWQPTLDNVAINTVAAGDEGFVASISSTEPSGTVTRVVASADGLEWFDAVAPWDGAFLTAPSRGDWIATTTRFATHGEPAAEVATWRSANGLDWSPLGEMALATIDLGDVQCLEFPGALHGLSTITVAGTVLSGPCGEGAVRNAGGSYASIGGAEWVRLPFGDQAYAAGAAMTGDRVVIATDSRTGRAPVIGVTFWVGEP